MLENLQRKVEQVAEAYADLIMLTINEFGTVKEGQEELPDSVKLNDIYEGIRILNHAANTLERIDRIRHGNAALRDFPEAGEKTGGAG